ncbi:hypothetical protein CRE_02837 [Caenorhabditis remanei]|uniref:Domain of unknown function WSN domain-containing protein n=1 Tax=Caenorhabditis remanei TaxID=31234 RepID=E3LW50_CAERE|nr:hypothetical protein CRE_02837 [Caenorhabditis remanei]
MNLIKLLILFILVGKSYGLVPVYGRPSVGNWSRFQRATYEEFSVSLKQMEMIAHIANGIHLQQGLMKGAIPPAELISEILNLGAIKPSDIHNIDTGKLKEVVNKVEGLLKSLDGSVGAIEDKLLKMRTVVERSNGVESLSQLGNEYLGEVVKMKNLKKSFNSYYITKLGDFLESSQALETQLEAGLVQNKLEVIKSSITVIKSKKFAEYVSLTGSKVMESSMKAFTSLVNFHRSVNTYLGDVQILQKNDSVDGKLKQMIANAQTIGTLIDTVKKSSLNFDHLRQVLVLRNQWSAQTLSAHTPGFPNGYSGIVSLADDLADDWTKTMVVGQAENLNKALESLKNIGRIAKEADNSFGQSYVGLADVSDTFLRLAQLSSANTTALASKLSQIHAAIQDKTVIPKNTENYGKLHTYIRLLFQQLNAIAEVAAVSVVLTSQENDKKLEKIMALADVVDGDEVLQKLSELKKNKDYQDICQVLRKISKSVELLSKGNVVVKPAENIAKSFGEMKTYVDDSAQFMNMLKTLRGIKEFEYIASFVDVRKSFGQIDTKKVKKFSSVSDNIENAKPKLTELEKAMNDMNGFTSFESDALTQSGDLKKDSDTLGSATRGILKIKRRFDEKVNMDDLESAEGMLPNAMASTKVKLTTEEENGVNKLKGLTRRLETSYTAIEDYITSFKSSKSDKLADYSDIFTKASSLPDISEDFQSMIFSTEKLASRAGPFYQAPMLATVKTLQKLDSLHLDFSKHRKDFSPAKESLNSLDLTFAKLPQLFTPTTTPATVTKTPSGSRSDPSKPGGQQSGAPGDPNVPGSQSGSEGETTTEATPTWKILLFILLTLFIIGVIVLIVIYFCCWGKVCCKKDIPPPPDDVIVDGKHSNSNENEQNKPEETTSQPVNKTNTEQEKNDGNSKDKVIPKEDDKSEKKAEKIEEQIPLPPPTILPEVGLKWMLWCQSQIDKRGYKPPAPLEIQFQHEFLEYDWAGMIPSYFNPKPYEIFDMMRMGLEKPIGHMQNTLSASDFDIGKDEKYTMANAIGPPWEGFWRSDGFFDCTIGTHFRMLQQKGIRRVVWTSDLYGGDWKSKNSFIPLLVGDVWEHNECKLKITCMNLNISDIDFQVRTLKIEFEDSPPFEIELVWNRTWKKYTPEDLNITLNVWRAIRGKGNVMLACDTDPNASYVFLELAYRELSTMKEVPQDADWAKNFSRSILQKIRNKIPFVFNLHDGHYPHVIMALLKLICDNYIANYKPPEDKSRIDTSEVDNYMLQIKERLESEEKKKKEETEGKKSKTSESTESTGLKMEDPKKKETGKSVSKGSSMKKKMNPSKGNQKKEVKKSQEKKTRTGESKVKKEGKKISADTKKTKAKK